MIVVTKTKVKDRGRRKVNLVRLAWDDKWNGQGGF